MGDAITRTERNDLMLLCRKREKLAKAMAAQRSAELLADFESKLAKEFAWSEQENWSAAMRRARELVRGLNETIREDLRELGVPPEFAPSAHVYWESRGENISSRRRAELRRVATAEIAAREKAAKVAIEMASVETQTQIAAGGLQSEDAKAFLEAMPTAREMMPLLQVGEVERLRTLEAA